MAGLRPKNVKVAEFRSEGQVGIDRGPACRVQVEHGRQEIAGRLLRDRHRRPEHQTQNANIRFEVLQGIKNTADFLIDFIFNSPRGHKGEWHVFFRGHTEAQATDYRQQMRDWYDYIEAERAQLAVIFKAKTTVRC